MTTKTRTETVDALTERERTLTTEAAHVAEQRRAAEQDQRDAEQRAVRAWALARFPNLRDVFGKVDQARDAFRDAIVNGGADPLAKWVTYRTTFAAACAEWSVISQTHHAHVEPWRPKPHPGRVLPTERFTDVVQQLLVQAEEDAAKDARAAVRAEIDAARNQADTRTEPRRDPPARPVARFYSPDHPELVAGIPDSNGEQQLVPFHDHVLTVWDDHTATALRTYAERLGIVEIDLDADSPTD